jgi:hypothetical protein
MRCTNHEAPRYLTSDVARYEVPPVIKHHIMNDHPVNGIEINRALQISVLDGDSEDSFTLRPLCPKADLNVVAKRKHTFMQVIEAGSSAHSGSFH